MERYLITNMILCILSFLLGTYAAIRILVFEFSCPSAMLAAAYLVLFIIFYSERRAYKKNRDVGEALFLREFGVKADKAEPLPLLPVSTYYRLQEGISKKSFHIKFRSQGKVYKGIIDKETQELYIQEPVLLPVYGDDLLPVWLYVMKIHKNGKPKKAVYYDEHEKVCGEEYFDETGGLKRGSWKRHKGIEVHWNQRKKVWEP